MNHTRRDLAALIPALLAARASADTALLPAKAYPFEKLPVKTNGGNQTRPVFDGETHSGFPIELHITNLPPGGSPHPPHHHVDEEIILVQEGTMEVTIAGNTTRLGPGSVGYVASNLEHGWRNVGAGRAQYFVFALGPKK